MNRVSNWEHKYSHSTVLMKQVQKTKGIGPLPLSKQGIKMFSSAFSALLLITSQPKFKKKCSVFHSTIANLWFVSNPFYAYLI